jgi:hypothetical protein
MIVEKRQRQTQILFFGRFFFVHASPISASCGITFYDRP